MLVLYKMRFYYIPELKSSHFSENKQTKAICNAKQITTVKTN